MSPELPDVSVIIPVYNGEMDIPDLVNCLLAQTYPSDRVEYLIVNNGSRDRTAELLERAAQEAETQGVTLKGLLEDQIQSSYAARNRGIRAARAAILAFADADCRPRPDWLVNLVQSFEKPEVGLVAGEILALPGETLLERHADRDETLSQKHTLAHPFCPYGQTANLAVRRQVFEQVGLFRPYLTTGGDADFCWRALRETEWQIEFAKEAIVQHRHRATWKDLMAQWRRYGRSNRFLHELHGVDLRPEFSQQAYLYRWSRWLLKEVPVKTLKLVVGRGTLVDLVSTPIGLFCAGARAEGQRTAQLPETARQIDRLP